MKITKLIFLILMSITAVSLSGAAAAAPPAETTVDLLNQSGFQAYPGRSPQAKAYMETCPKNALMIHSREGATAYCYVDPSSNTMYMGDEEAYQRLQNILNNTNQIIPEQKIQDDPEFWKLWESRRGLG